MTKDWPEWLKEAYQKLMNLHFPDRKGEEDGESSDSKRSS